MALFKRTKEQDVEPRLPRSQAPPWEIQDTKAGVQAQDGDERPGRVSLAVIVARVFFVMAVLGLLASVIAIALIWIYARDISTWIVVLLIISTTVTGVMAYALTDKAL